MAKVRVASRQVIEQLKELAPKRNLKAWKVQWGPTDNEKKFFEEAMYAYRYASMECRGNTNKYEVYENVGDEEYVLHSIYERGTATPVQRGRKPRKGNFKLKDMTQEERWVRAKNDISVGIMIRKYPKESKAG